MTEKKDECGVKYTLDVLEDRWQPRIIFWLGFRPFTIEPEKDASMSELIKYNEQLNKYMQRVEAENNLLPCGDAKLVPRYLTLFFVGQNNL